MDVPQSPHLLALISALFSAVATILIQRGLQRSSFYAGFWFNVAVGVVGLWAAVLVLVPPEGYYWRALPYFALSGVMGTAAGGLESPHRSRAGLVDREVGTVVDPQVSGPAVAAGDAPRQPLGAGVWPRLDPHADGEATHIGR